MQPPAGSILGRLLPRCRFPEPGTAVACAVSGGADSLALLVLACEAGPGRHRHPCRPRVRPGSSVGGGDRGGGGRRRFGAAFVARRVARGSRPQPRGPGPAGPLRRPATWGAHRSHRRRPGRDGPAQPAAGGRRRRPGRDAGARAGRPPPPRPAAPRDPGPVRASWASQPVDDPTNADPAFARNRIRHDPAPAHGRARRAGPGARCWPARPGCWRTTSSCSTTWPPSIDPSRRIAPWPPPSRPWPAGPCGGGCGPAPGPSTIRRRRLRSSGSWRWPGAASWPASWPAGRRSDGQPAIAAVDRRRRSAPSPPTALKARIGSAAA